MNHFMRNKKTLKKCSVVCTLETKTESLLNEPIYNDKIIYFILPSKVVVDETLYDTYGIGAYSNEMVVDYVSDLSPDFQKVKLLVDLCNKEALPLMHLKDVAENFIEVQHAFF